MTAREINPLFQWLRPPINWDPVPDWLLNRIDERVLVRLFLSDVELQRNVLQLQMDALSAKAEILQKELGG